MLSLSKWAILQTMVSIAGCLGGTHFESQANHSHAIRTQWSTGHGGCYVKNHTLTLFDHGRFEWEDEEITSCPDARSIFERSGTYREDNGLVVLTFDGVDPCGFDRTGINDGNTSKKVFYEFRETASTLSGSYCRLPITLNRVANSIAPVH